MNYNQIMLDLETLGTSRDAAIVSIGAVKFCLKELRLGDEFHAKINLKDPDLGKIDGSTVAWWLTQSEEARQALVAPGCERLDLDSALSAFHRWLGMDAENLYLWSNGPTFDSVILQAAFERTGNVWPFRYNADRDFRTIRDIGEGFFGMSGWDHKGIAHDALADAKNQAEFAIEVARKLHGGSR